MVRETVLVWTVRNSGCNGSAAMAATIILWVACWLSCSPTPRVLRLIVPVMWHCYWGIRLPLSTPVDVFFLFRDRCTSEPYIWVIRWFFYLRTRAFRVIIYQKCYKKRKELDWGAGILLQAMNPVRNEGEKNSTFLCMGWVFFSSNSSLVQVCQNATTRTA